MRTDDPHFPRARQPDALDSYRRLIDLQKQMIELSQQHEQSKRECAALRELVAREMAGRMRPRRTLRERMQHSAGKFLKRVPGYVATELKLTALNRKQVLSC